MTVKHMQICPGFSLIELLVGLTISSVLLSLVVRVYDANHRLFLTNKAQADVFYDGQFIIPLLNSNIALAGNTNVYSNNLNNQAGNTQINLYEEAEFISNNAIAKELSFPLFPLIGSKEGGSKNGGRKNKADQIVINTTGVKSCTGTNFDFNDDELFHLVNQYYLEGTTLRCKSYDGRYLRGLKSSTSANYSVSLLENVYDFQVQYAIEIKSSINTENALNAEETVTENHFIWLNADELTGMLTEDNQVLAVNIVLLLGVKTVTGLSKQTPIKLFDNRSFIAADNLLVRKFETIVVLKA